MIKKNKRKEKKRKPLSRWLLNQHVGFITLGHKLYLGQYHLYHYCQTERGSCCYLFINLNLILLMSNFSGFNSVTYTCCMFLSTQSLVLEVC